MAAPSTPGWQEAILSSVGAKPTSENLRFIDAWVRAEGGSAENNPFNTTQSAPGATNYNSVGVRRYTSPNQGIQATIKTLLNGRYGNILYALRDGSSADADASALAHSPWGTGTGVQRVLGSAPGSAGIGVHAAVPSTRTPMPSAPTADTRGNASRALLQMVLGSSQSIAAGKGPQQDSQQLLSLLSGMGHPESGTSSSPTGVPGPPSSGDPSPSGGDKGTSIVQAAHGFLGIPYLWGGNDPRKGLDCSSFLQQAMAKAGIHIQRTTYDQIKQGQAVELSQLRPGDAVFTEPGSRGPEHVGLYIGNGQIQQSPHHGTVNSTIPLKDFLGGGFVGARRYG